MDGILMKNGEGILGLAVVDEKRKIKKIIYLTHAQNLSIVFEDGEIETLQTEIDQEFEQSLFGRKTIFVGHFPKNGLDKEPTSEYYVPLER